MNIFKRILRGTSSSNLTEEQSRALLDILICVMMADGRQESSELEELTLAIHQMHLDDETAMEAYVEHKKREFSGVVDVRAIFSHAAEVLNEPWMREHVYYLAAKFATSDNEIHAGETEVLHNLIVALDIPREKLRIITQRLNDEDDL